MILVLLECNPPLSSASTTVSLDLWLIKVEPNIIIKYSIYFIINKQISLAPAFYYVVKGGIIPAS